MKITFPAVFCLLVSSAAAIANPPFTVSPETTAITGPLRRMAASIMWPPSMPALGNA